MTTTSDLPLLVVCHEATRTGGSKVMADLLDAARPHLTRPLRIQLLAGGPLTDRLSSFDDGEAAGRSPVAVVVNSALAAGAVEPRPHRPVLVYVHEEADALHGLSSEAMRTLADPSTTVLCVSEASRTALGDLGVERDRIGLLPPVVPVTSDPGPEQRARVRAQAGGTGVRLVVGCGEASWRKGADLFAEVARLTRDRDDVRFVWVGRRPRGFSRRLDHDAARLGESVTWTGELADTRAHLAEADLVLMTSREDPRPLVPLEAAHLGTPTLAFDVGGLADLGRAGAAATVSFPDLPALHTELCQLIDDEARRAELADRARQRALSQAPEVVVPQFLEAIRSLIDRARGDRA